MTWQRSTLCIPEQLAPVNCSTVVVHPWAFGVGQVEESGAFLSPTNAVNALTAHLVGVDSAHEVAVFLIAATTLSDFINQLRSVSNILPLPAITYVHRRAKAAAELNASKMQLPGRSLTLPPAAPLSAATTRQALTAQAMLTAACAARTSGGNAAIDTALAAFVQRRAQLLADAKANLATLQGATTSIWAFSAASVQRALTDMKKDIPTPHAIFSVALLFVGADLTPLKGMVGHG